MFSCNLGILKGIFFVALYDVVRIPYYVLNFRIQGLGGTLQRKVYHKNTSDKFFKPCKQFNYIKLTPKY